MGMSIPGISGMGVGALAPADGGSGGGGGGLVSITNQTVISSGLGTQTATYRVNTSGVVERGVRGVFSMVETWLLSGAPADYEVSATATGGEGITGGSGLGAWLGLGTTRSWFRTEPLTETSSTASILVSIRLAVAPFTVLDSANITLQTTVL